MARMSVAQRGELRRQIHEEEERLAGLYALSERSRGEDKRAVDREAAESSEAIQDLRRRLKAAMPQHRVHYTRVSLDALPASQGVQEGGFDPWADPTANLACGEESENSDWQDEGGVLWQSDRELMREALAAAQKHVRLTEKQQLYFRAAELPCRTAARELGVNPSTVCVGRKRAVNRLKNYAQARFQAAKYLRDQMEDGQAPRALAALLSSVLTPTQLLYCYLYYGEWMSLREIGELLGRNQGTVLRCLRRGLENLSPYVPQGQTLHVGGLEEMLISLYDSAMTQRPDPTFPRPHSDRLRRQFGATDAPREDSDTSPSCIDVPYMIRSRGRLLKRLRAMLLPAAGGVLTALRRALRGMVERLCALYGAAGKKTV